MESDDLKLQNSGSAKDVLGNAAERSEALEPAVAGWLGPAAPFDPVALMGLQQALRSPEGSGFQAQVRVAFIESGSAFLMSRPNERPRPSRARNQPGVRGRLLLALFASILILGALLATWQMVSRTLPLDATLLVRKVSAKLATQPD